MKARQGSVIMFAIAILTFGVILSFALLPLVRSDMVRTKTFRDEYINFYMAESGINSTLKYIEENSSDFRTEYEGTSTEISSRFLEFEVKFPNDENICSVEISSSAEYGERYLEIKSTYNEMERYYLVQDTGSAYIPVKFLDR